MSGSPLDGYDEVPYPSSPYPQSHPGRLAAIAVLFGMTPPPVETARVLELGCADGANLVPLAYSFPEGKFVGVELSRRQVETGLELIQKMGLQNIELVQQSLLDVDRSLGEFDYIIAHGVFSWTARDAQEKLLAICGSQLAPHGVAYISYNTNPGWRMRGMLRDMMLYHTMGAADANSRVAQSRALIRFLAEAVTAADDPYAMLLKAELEQMKSWDDAYLLHDSLEEVNEPIYFHEFIERAEKHGLRYLGEAEFHTMLGGSVDPNAVAKLTELGADIVQMEQYLDFLRNRMFRQTLLCHRDVQLQRNVTPQRLKNLHAASNLRADVVAPEIAEAGKIKFAHDSGVGMSVATPLAKAAMQVLAESWPAAVAYSRLADLGRQLLAERHDVAINDDQCQSQMQILDEALLIGYSNNLLELYAAPLPLDSSAGLRPLASHLARLQAESGGKVTNQRHDQVNLDAFHRQLVLLLDGTRDRPALAAALTELACDGVLTVKQNGQPVTDRDRILSLLGEQLDSSLKRVASAALLVSS